MQISIRLATFRHAADDASDKVPLCRLSLVGGDGSVKLTLSPPFKYARQVVGVAVGRLVMFVTKFRPLEAPGRFVARFATRLTLCSRRTLLPSMMICFNRSLNERFKQNLPLPLPLLRARHRCYQSKFRKDLRYAILSCQRE